MKYSLEGLLQQLMQNANRMYITEGAVRGMGFVVGAVPGTEVKRCAIIYPEESVGTPDGLNRFAVRLRRAVQSMKALEAGVMCTMEAAIDGGPREMSVVLYADQKFGGMRLLVAPLRGAELVFRDMGIAHPVISFLPALFTADAYPTAVSEA